MPEPKIVEPEKKFLETRSRHQERIEAARNQARAKDMQRRRSMAPSAAKRVTQDEMKGRALRWRNRHVQSERTKYPSHRVRLARLRKVRETVRAGRPEFTARELRRSLRAQEAREQREQEHYYRPPELPRSDRSHGISR